MVDDSKKDEEAKRAAELLELGIDKETAAERMGLSPSTFERRLKRWERKVSKEPETDEDRLKNGENIASTIQAILSDGGLARQLGEVAGADIATLEQTLRRIIRGEATKGEIHKIRGLVGGIADGFMGGREYHKSLILPNHDSVVSIDELKKEIKKEVLAEIKSNNPKKTGKKG